MVMNGVILSLSCHKSIILCVCVCVCVCDLRLIPEQGLSFFKNLSRNVILLSAGNHIISLGNFTSIKTNKVIH